MAASTTTSIRFSTAPELRSRSRRVPSNPTFTVTAFAQGSMGCVFRVKADDSGDVIKVEEYSPEVGMLESKIMKRLKGGGDHIALTTIQVASAVNVKGNSFELRTSGSPSFSIPRKMFMNPEKGCGKLKAALKQGGAKLLVSRGEQYDGDVRSLGSELDLFDFAAQMDEALAFLRERRVIHRDIKPENVYFLREPSGNIVYKLGDFGLATFADKDGITTDKIYAGTMVFLDKPCLYAWEHDEEVPCSSFATDRFALGATLIQLWARTLGDTTDGPLYARAQDKGENDYAYCRTTIDEWTAYLHDEGPLPATALSKKMDSATKNLIAKYYIPSE